MQKTTLILLLAACFAATPTSAQPGSQPPPAATTPTFPLVTRLISIYKKLDRFSVRYRDVHEERYADSVEKYNARFFTLITSPGMTRLTPADWHRLTMFTDLKIISSGDGRLRIVSWLLENPYPTPAYCSSVIFAGGRPPITGGSAEGNEGDGDGNNTQPDTIIDVRLQGQPYYLVFGSNKCAALCELEVASLYRLHDKEIIRCDSAFYDDSAYSNEVSFNYRLDNDLKSDPAFALEGDVVICPVFDDGGHQLIGRKRYRLMPNGR